MKEQLISFETAKLAKEKGFGVGFTTQYCYSSDNDGLHIANFDNAVKTKPDELFLAPTQSLLQKWLREKYHLFVCVAHNSLESHFPMIQLLDIDGSLLKGPPYLKNYKTHEEALEIGLQEALKLKK